MKLYNIARYCLGFELSIFFFYVFYFDSFMRNDKLAFFFAEYYDDFYDLF